MEKKKLIGFYDYTVVLTYMGMVIAFAGILKAINTCYVTSLLCLMAAGVCDMFDGAVASTKDRDCFEKHFGIQIDSMCDLISFGVLPAIFAYKITGEKIIIAILAGVFLLCGLIRLAFYNVQEFDRQQKTTACRECFLGVPITTSALFFPLCYLIYYYFSISEMIIFPIALIILGAGYIAGIEIKKPRKIGKIVLIIIGLIELVGVIALAKAGV